jgi:hypothetical protein
MIILLFTLFQLYFQYSSFITQRNNELDKIDRRGKIYTINIGKKILDLNLGKIEECFNDSSLMNINLLRNSTLNYIEKIDAKRGSKLDQKVYMFFYITITDLLYIINLYIFYFGNIISGIIKIIFQILKFFFSYKRLKKTSPDSCIFRIIKNYIDNIKIRELSFLEPEGYAIIDHLCNYVIIFDIIYLIILFKNNCCKKKEEGKTIIIKQAQEEQIIENDDNNNNNTNEKEQENQDDIINENNNNSNNFINNESNNEYNNENENNNNVQTGKISLEEEENEDDNEIEEEPLNEQETK